VEGLGVNPSFWYGKRVFLTGHTGFKGTWLTRYLLQYGIEVVGYSLSPKSNDLFSRAGNCLGEENPYSFA
jgi:CDP-glucose 4,6-dehydratase